VSGWEAIRDHVAQQIRSRAWPPGSRIPNEADLARDLGVARGTINRALSALAADGLLERRRRAGTRVAPLPVRQARLAIPVIRAEIAARGAVPRHHVLTDEAALPPAAIAARLALPADRPLRFLRTLFLADNSPFALEDRWLNPAILGASGAALSFETVSANEWLVANVPLASGDLAFSAEAASAEEAAILACAVGAALFVTERVTRAASGPVTAVRLAHAPGYRVSMHL
jgi:GntR family transcriptional regulator, histidine utilization repressor